MILKRTICDCSQLFLFFGAKIGPIGVSFKGSAATKSRADILNVTYFPEFKKNNPRTRDKNTPVYFLVNCIYLEFTSIISSQKIKGRQT